MVKLESGIVMVHSHSSTAMMLSGVIFMVAASSIAQTESPASFSVKPEIISAFAGNQMEFAPNKMSLQLSAPPDQGSTTSSGDLNLFGNVGNNVLDSFKGNNIYFHLTAITATSIIVPTGIDYGVEHFFNTHPEYGKWARPVVFTGELLPFVAGGSLLAYGEIGKNKEVLGASFAVIQASLIELLYNSTLKAITGRPNPDWRHVSNMDSLSRTFRFGFLRGGVFWGWPSGHTAATTAVMSALMSYYPNSTWLKVAGYGLIAYTIFGVSANNRGGMHWFSDAVAGALMAYAVGSTVGKYYRSVHVGERPGSVTASGYTLAPQVNPLGINFSIQF